MLQHFRAAGLAAVAAIALIAVASCEEKAAERGTAEEAQAMVANAIAVFDAKGETVFADITQQKEGYRDRDLYIFVIGPDQKVVAHGGFAERVGINVLEQVDPDGKEYGKAFIAEATADGVWVDYKFNDPESGEVLPKSSWVVLHNGYIFGCGIYKP